MKGSFGESMKKILSLLLVIVCVISMAACSIGPSVTPGPNPEEQPAETDDIFEIAAKGLVPTKIVSLSTFNCKDLKGANVALAGNFTQVVNGNNSILDFKYDRFATIDEAADSYIVNVEGAIAIKDGKTKTIGNVASSSDWAALIPSLQQLGAFKLDKSMLPEDYKLSSDGQKLTVSLSGEEALRVIGEVIPAVGDISLEVETNGKNISLIVISYTAPSGANVRIANSFTYGVQTLDFSRFN